jgi:hypothetical protein
LGTPSSDQITVCYLRSVTACTEAPIIELQIQEDLKEQLENNKLLFEEAAVAQTSFN